MHDWFTLGMGTCGTLSLDFPVLAEEEIVCGTRPQKKLQVPRPMKVLSTAAGHCILASLHLYLEAQAKGALPNLVKLKIESMWANMSATQPLSNSKETQTPLSK